MPDQTRPLIAFGASTAGAIGFIVAYAIDAGIGWLGVCLGVALAGLGVGLVTWSSSIDPGDAVEQRHPLAPTHEESAAQREVIETGAALLGRRTVIFGALGAAVASIAAMLVVPLRSLGPRPRAIGASPWSPGRRLVTSDGRPVPSGAVARDALLTVYPEGDLDSGDGPVVVVRVPEEQLTDRTVAGGAVGGIVAYSKICTHAGCAVGLFQADSREPRTIHRLLCPCHQSEFDPVDGARPVAGPATRSLPQLPIEVDGDGNLVAIRGFDRRVGPASWTWP